MGFNSRPMCLKFLIYIFKFLRVDNISLVLFANDFLFALKFEGLKHNKTNKVKD